MKLLILSNKPPFPPKDGGAIAIFNVAAGIATCGHSVHILAANTPKHFVETASLPTFENITLQYVFVNTSVSAFDTAVNLVFSLKPYISERFKSDNYRKALIDLLKNNTFDVVQFEGPYLWHYYPLVRKYSEALISLRAHNIEHEIWERTAHMERSYVRKLYLKNLAGRIKRFEKRIINTYDMLLPITNRDAAIFAAMGNTKATHTVPVGIVSGNVDEEVRPNPNSVFFIGALDWIPNQEGLLWFVEHVWPRIVKLNPMAILHIAGRNAPKWLALRLSVKNALFHGEVDDSAHFMKHSGLMIAPLFSGSGMRVKIIEGMFLGKAILTTAIGAEGIECTDGRNICIANSQDEFVIKLDKLLNDPALVKQMGANARTFATEKYDYVEIAKGLVEFYQKQCHG